MNNSGYLREFSFRSFLDLVFRQKLVIILTLCIVNIIVFIGLLLVTPVYEARVKMLISAEKQVQAPYYNELGGFGGSLVHMTQTVIVKSNPVIERSVKALKLDRRPLDYEKHFCHFLKIPVLHLMSMKLRRKIETTSPEEARDYIFWSVVENLKDQVRVELIPNTNIFEIIARDFSPKTAMEIANVISRSYAIYDLQQQLAELTIRYGERHPSVQQLRDNIANMNASLTGERLPDIEAIGTASVKIIEQATTDFKPAGKSKFLILLISIIVSVFLGLSLSFVFDYLDPGFKSPQDTVNLLRIPILGSVPLFKSKKRFSIHSPIGNERYMSFYTDLADQIYIFMKTMNITNIQLAPILSGAGNTTITVNIGNIFSEQLNKRTLLIDANLRDPGLHKHFDFENNYGLANLLEQKMIEYRSPLMIDGEVRQADSIPPVHGDVIEEEGIVAEARSMDSHNDAVYTKRDFSSADSAAVDAYREKTSMPPSPQSEITRDPDPVDDTFLDNVLHHVDHNLYVLPAGRATGNPVILLDNFLMDSVLKTAKNRFEAVFIDSPSLNMFKDAAILSSRVDGVALVVDECRDKRHVVKASIDLLEQKKAKMLGFILNKRILAIPDFIYKRL